MNNTVLIGRLVRDPDVQYTTNQTAMCKFTLAVNRLKKDEGADFIRIVCFGKLAENCGRYLAKGRQAAIQGRIQTGSYKDKDGKTVYTTDVIASNVEFLGGSNSNSSQADDAAVNEQQDFEDLPFERVDDNIPF